MIERICISRLTNLGYIVLINNRWASEPFRRYSQAKRFAEFKLEPYHWVAKFPDEWWPELYGWSAYVRDITLDFDLITYTGMALAFRVDHSPYQYISKSLLIQAAIEQMALDNLV